MTAIKLSKDQRAVYDAIRNWTAGDETPDEMRANEFGDPGGGRAHRLLKVGGLAGTGKTTLLSKFAAETNVLLVAYCAYTGRAASLLARKFKAFGVRSTSKTLLPEGMKPTERALESCYEEDSPEMDMPFVGTIHRLLYRPVIDPVTEELKGWVKRRDLDRAYHLIVIDEASMVGDDILQDFQTHGVPILAVGDHGQLPPVMSTGGLMEKPDLTLEKIHRQAEGSDIIRLAHHVRSGESLASFKPSSRGAVTFARRAEVARVLEEALPGAGLDAAVICWTNRMRVKLNALSRAAVGLKGPPRKGDLVVALRNYPPICNGFRGVLLNDSAPGQKPWQLHLDVDFPDEGFKDKPMVNAAQFNREKTFGSVDELRDRGIDVFTMSAVGHAYDFGFALTAHKMQGSGVPHAIVYIDRHEDPSNDDWRRWAYTAATRASEKLTILRG